jgi:hypothetical protein
MSANKCREMTGDDLSATFRTATLNVALGPEAEIQTETLPTIPGPCRQNESFETR